MITAILGVLTPIFGKVLDFIPNPVEREKARLEMEAQVRAQEAALLQAFMQADQAQTDVNKVEAASPNLFIAGPRPFVMWVCGFAFAWVYLLQPVITFVFSACGHPIHDLPTLDFSEMSTVLMGLLGLGGMRSFEKYHNVQGNH